MEKYNHATSLGWRIFRLVPNAIVKEAGLLEALIDPLLKFYFPDPAVPR
jgi:hypothetical protein